MIDKPFIPDWAMLRPFAPELVLVSAGFDAARGDPLGEMLVSPAGFAFMCGVCRRIAERHAGGQIVLVVEGGYEPAALAANVRACVEALAGADGPEIPHGETGRRIAGKLRPVLAPYWPVLND